MAEIDIKQASRERMEMRLYVTETLKALIDWVTATKPSEYIPPAEKGTPIVPEERLRAKWQDWVDKSSELLDGAWKLPTLLRDDAISLMEEIVAKPKGTPESK
jgi:hypothetical protein